MQRFCRTGNTPLMIIRGLRHVLVKLLPGSSAVHSAFPGHAGGTGPAGSQGSTGNTGLQGPQGVTGMCLSPNHKLS